MGLVFMAIGGKLAALEIHGVGVFRAIGVAANHLDLLGWLAARDRLQDLRAQAAPPESREPVGTLDVLDRDIPEERVAIRDDQRDAIERGFEATC